MSTAPGSVDTAVIEAFSHIHARLERSEAPIARGHFRMRERPQQFRRLIAPVQGETAEASSPSIQQGAQV